MWYFLFFILFQTFKFLYENWYTWIKVDYFKPCFTSICQMSCIESNDKNYFINNILLAFSRSVIKYVKIVFYININCYIPVCIPHLQNKLCSGNPEAPTICPTICTSAMIWNIAKHYFFTSINFPIISLDSFPPIKASIIFIEKILNICSETRVMSVSTIFQLYSAG